MSMNRGISETMSIDYSKHSLFGVSKAAADLLAQEYGRYFGLPTVSFRGGCLTGSAHAGTELHGFLSYLMICVVKIGRIGSSDAKGNKCAITSTASILSKHSLNSFARRGT
jgi:nucleoside-diphosphate-sugar epimerase